MRIVAMALSVFASCQGLFGCGRAGPIGRDPWGTPWGDQERLPRVSHADGSHPLGGVINYGPGCADRDPDDVNRSPVE